MSTRSATTTSIRLTLGKSELPPAETVTAAMVDAVTTHAKATLVFPPGLPELRERIALDYKERHGVAIDPRTVLVNVGTSSLFRNIFQLLAGERRRGPAAAAVLSALMICACW